MLKGVNTICIRLVPKVPNLASLGEYRVVACCIVMYKCITKVLTNRMKRFVNQVISLNQYAFLPGRYIQDNILLPYEILHGSHMNTGKARCAAKVNLRKAYETVRWESIEYVLGRIGVPKKFKDWVKTCVEMPMFTIMINGASYGYFGSKRGTRQGIPTSPYLFVLVMDLFTDIIRRAVNNGEIRLHYRCTEPVITHLFFTDDLIAFFNWDVESARGIKKVLLRFRECSKLQVNEKKSQLFSAGMSAEQAKR